MPFAAAGVWSAQVHKSACDIRALPRVNDQAAGTAVGRGEGLLPQGESLAGILPDVTCNSRGRLHGLSTFWIACVWPASAGRLLATASAVMWTGITVVLVGTGGGQWDWRGHMIDYRGQAWLWLFDLCVGNHSLLDAGTLTEWVRLLCMLDHVMFSANLWCRYCCSPSFAHEEDWAVGRLDL